MRGIDKIRVNQSFHNDQTPSGLTGGLPARVYVAKPIGSTPALVASTASVRAWVEIGKGF